jgi:hypothetical protein
MKRSHSDSRYYLCSEKDCTGQMHLIGHEPRGKKQAVYECDVCRRKRGESSLLTAFKQLRMRD